MNLPDTSNRSGIASVAAGVLLAAISLVLADSDRSHALKTIDPVLEAAACYATCGTTLNTCTAQCCGVLFCSKRCVDTCNSHYSNCLDNCIAFCGNSSCDPDGAFFDTATIAGNGRSIRIGGPFDCPETAIADLDVTLTQSASGAVATGHAQLKCPLDDETFTVDVHTDGNARFLPLTGVQACATAHVHAVNSSIDAFQWCREVTLLPEGLELQDEE
jgi:hypothetical protein